ncbi:sigma factor-like helix-turn-helix DNA-binding protein [Micromonospora sp. M12]
MLVLRYWEDLSIEDVAALLECSPGTVKSQSARGLDTLRGLLAPTYSGIEMGSDERTRATRRAPQRDGERHPATTIEYGAALGAARRARLRRRTVWGSSGRRPSSCRLPASRPSPPRTPLYQPAGHGPLGIPDPSRDTGRAVALAQEFWGMQGECQVESVGAARVGVVVRPGGDDRLDQWSAYRHPDGVVVFVAQGVRLDESRPELTTLPFSRRSWRPSPSTNGSI